MPPFLIGIILDLVMKLGLPLLITWLKKVFGIGASAETVKILEDYVVESRADKRAARERARQRLRECHGLECPTP
jgi:hypothetical protein